MNYIMVFAGGGLGSAARYFFSKTVAGLYNTGFPGGTLFVNLCGCFIIGMLFGYFEQAVIPPHARLFIFVGFLGGFTTFSSYGLETWNLMAARDYYYAAMNIVFNNIGGMMLVWAGLAVAREILLKK